MARSCPQQTGRMTPGPTYMYYPGGISRVGDFAGRRGGGGLRLLRGRHRDRAGLGPGGLPELSAALAGLLGLVEGLVRAEDEFRGVGRVQRIDRDADRDRQLQPLRAAHELLA